MARLVFALLLLGLSAARADQPTQPANEAMPMNQTHHVIDYIEIRITDMQATKAFYGAAFDWQFTDYGPDYAGIQKPGGVGEVGGLAVVDAVAPGGPLVILYSSDLESTRQRVVDAGGRITVEPFAFPGGRRFHFTDPSGNELAVWSDQ
ncbi:MAG: VOC family protein [Halieaceae bacterium]|jgi:predicted enzyme related to lactoylglutathione lyase|nr:VOC family protein [Halieaceae bacterium]